MFELILKICTLITYSFMIIPLEAMNKLKDSSENNKNSDEKNVQFDGNCAPSLESSTDDLLKIPLGFDGKCQVRLSKFGGDDDTQALSVNKCQNNQHGASQEILYSADSGLGAQVQCENCDLSVKTGYEGVYVRCSDCFDLNSKSDQQKIKKDILYMAYFIQIANYTRPTKEGNLP